MSDIATNGSYFAIGRLVDILGLHGEVPEEERIENDADGLMRLVTCLYDLSPDQNEIRGINPHIVNVETGEVQQLALYEERFNILSGREKEILLLIKRGLLSKEIADTLHISIHTVNTHRQNILQKLSVNNSMEAVQTATAMMLL